MYEIIFPENRERFVQREFDSVEDARSFIENLTIHWGEIPSGGDDSAAYMYQRTGAIIVIREVRQ